jgi:hypothetical protein
VEAPVCRTSSDGSRSPRGPFAAASLHPAGSPWLAISLRSGPAQPQQVLAVELHPVRTIKDRDQSPASSTRIIQVNFVQQRLGFQVIRTVRHATYATGDRATPAVCMAISCSVQGDSCRPFRRVPSQTKRGGTFDEEPTSTGRRPILECRLAPLASLFPWPVSKTHGAPWRHQLPPHRRLHRMDGQFIGKLLDRPNALWRFQRRAGLELRAVSCAFGFNSVVVGFGPDGRSPATTVTDSALARCPGFT